MKAFSNVYYILVTKALKLFLKFMRKPAYLFDLGIWSYWIAYWIVKLAD